MKERLKALRSEHQALQDKVETYIKEYAGLTPEDMVGFHPLYGWVEFNIVGLGSGTIYRRDLITEFQMNAKCAQQFDTVEEFQAALDAKKEREKIPTKIFLAVRYITDL